MEQIENVLPFPFSRGNGGDAVSLCERDRTATFSSLLSTEVSWFIIALAVFAFNFVKVQRERPLRQTQLITSQTARARQHFNLENN